MAFGSIKVAVFLSVVIIASLAISTFPLPTSALTAVSKPRNYLAPTISGLVAWWNFDEGTGLTATDRSGNGHDGTLSALCTPTWVQGKFGKAVHINHTCGDTSRILTGDIDETDGQSQLTVMAWIKPDDYLDHGFAHSIVSKFQGDPGSNGWYLSDTNQTDLGGLRFTPDENNDGNQDYTKNSGHPLIATSTWNHVAAVYDGGQAAQDNKIHLYINGTEQYSTVLNTILNTTKAGSTHEVAIGNDPVANLAYHGTIDEVRIYNRALTPAEISSLYWNGQVRTSVNTSELAKFTTLNTGLVGHWTFDGLSSTSTIADSSGNGNVGYFFNGPTTSAKVAGKFGQAAKFNGTNFARVDGVAGDIASGAASISLWLRTDATFNASSPAEMELFSMSDLGSTNDMRLYLGGSGRGNDAGKLFWETNHDTSGLDDDMSTSANWSANTWYHVVATISSAGTLKKLYINGAFNAQTTPANVRSAFPSAEAHIAELDTGADKFTGRIDDMRVYNRELSAAEVKLLYGLGRATMKP